MDGFCNWELLKVRSFQRKLSLSEVYTSLWDEFGLSGESKVSPFSSNRGSGPASSGKGTVGALGASPVCAGTDTSE